MASTLYAWAPIGRRKDQRVAEVGDAVTAEKLKMDKEEFASLEEAGVVRDKKPPKLPEGYSGSMIDFLREQIRDAADLGTTIDEVAVEELQAIGEVS